MIKKCVVCDENFESMHGSEKYCGNDCRHIAKKDRRKNEYREKCNMGIPVPIGVGSITEDNKKALSMGMSYGKMKALETLKNRKEETSC